MSRIRVAVIGVGHLGKELARILAGMEQVELVGVADVIAQQVQAVALRCNTRAYVNYNELLEKTDAVIIAVPTCHHRSVATACLERGIHCLVEKPLTATLADALFLNDLAAKRGAILQVGHIERFNPAWEEFSRRPLRPKLISAERLSPYSGRSTDVGAVLDLMIHDLDLVASAVNAPVVHVEAVGIALLGGHEDMVQARLRFENGCVAHLRASRVHASGSRHMQLWGAEGFAALDFTKRTLQLVQPSSTLRNLQQGRVKPTRESASVRDRASLRGDQLTSHLETLTLDCSRPGDQLTAELQDFVSAIQNGRAPRVSGDDGCRAVALAEQVIQAVTAHRWEGTSTGPIGPFDLPLPQGQLFQPPSDIAAA
jgi:predicted dehydrogenase